MTAPPPAAQEEREALTSGELDRLDATIAEGDPLEGSVITVGLARRLIAQARRVASPSLPAEGENRIEGRCVGAGWDELAEDGEVVERRFLIRVETDAPPSWPITAAWGAPVAVSLLQAPPAGKTEEPS